MSEYLVKSRLGCTYDLKEALRHNPTIIRAGDDICAVSLARIEELEASLAKTVITLKLLVDVSVMMQSATSHNKHRHNTVITDTMWAQWSKQLKYTRTTIAELKGQDDE